LAPVIAGLVGATVYGRFHYVLDVVAGLLLALLVMECDHLCRRKRLALLRPAE